MLKLKSVVKTREQLLATGWQLHTAGDFFNEVNSVTLWINPKMLGGVYNGVIQGQKYRCKLDRIGGTWNLHPEMVLLLDQWGFVRDPETLDVLMWDAICGKGVVKAIDSEVKDIDNGNKFPIHITDTDRGSDCYTKEGKFISKSTPQLSKYPCSLVHGGYTPFDFEELKQAFYCEKTTPPAAPSDIGNFTKTDLCASAVMPESKGHVEVTPETQVKDESGSVSLDGVFGEKEMQIWSEISTRERVVSLLERLENLRSSDLPGVKEKVEAVMLDMVKKLVV